MADTVEKALDELREMFELAYLWIEHAAVYASEPDQPIGTKERWSVGVDYRRFNGDSLSDALAQAREWKMKTQTDR